MTHPTDKRYFMIVDDLDGHISQIGDTVMVDSSCVPVVTDPEHVDLEDYVEGLENDNCLGVITNTIDGHNIRLAELRPAAEPTFDFLGQAWCPAGWTIVDFLPYTAMFGRDGDRIAELIAADIVRIPSDDDSNHVFSETCQILIERDPRWSAGRAATRALAAAGIPHRFWDGVGWDPSGCAALAVRARPYLGLVAGWNQDTYDHLCMLHHRIRREPAHPDDVLQAV